jgi:hypothetical protein
MYRKSLRTPFLVSSLWTLSLLVAGCQNAAPGSASKAAMEGGAPAAASMDTANLAAPGAPGMEAATGGVSGTQERGGAAVATAGQAPVAPAMPRKIIYTATVEMVCEKFTDSARKLADAVKAHGGFIADSNVVGAAGDAKTGTWKVRIPVERFDAFMTALGGVGEVQSANITSQDVSEEFYDLEARIKNKRVEEARLIQHLQQSTGKLNEILAVEREISRVREEVERMEGRQRFLANQTALTTVTVTLRELRSVAVTREEQPTLWTQMTRTFGGSLAALGDFMKGIVLFLVGALPWLVVVGGIVYPLWRARRKRAAARKTNAVRMYSDTPGGDA